MSPNVTHRFSILALLLLVAGLFALNAHEAAASRPSSVGAAVLAPAAAGFTDIGAALTGVTYASVEWGDYDSDGDLDIVLSGTFSSGSITRVYRNNGNSTFTDIDAGLPGTSSGAVAWGDYDNDGDRDILLTGTVGAGGIARVYRNNGNNTFTDINATLPGVRFSAVDWGDYDNDGDLDILLAGYTGQGYITRVYRNNGNNTFTDIAATLPGVEDSAVEWGDYDNDGDLDILLTGDIPSAYITRVYRNNGNSTFTDVNAALPGVEQGAAAWGDYDNDGDLDILLSGWTGADPITRVYRNNGNNTFTDISAALPGLYVSAVDWGDYDNDGDLDILLSGQSGSTEFITRVYRNDGNNTFTDIAATLPGVTYSAAEWGDYDNDGDLDILLAGQPVSGEYITRVYRLDGVPANTPPSAPTGLSAGAAGSRATLSWNPATDSQTPPGGLSYNLRVGTTPGGQDIMAPMSRIDATSSITAPNGWRRIPDRGPIQTISHTLTLTPGLTYYWSVQAVDTAFAGSPFSAEGSFTTSPSSSFTDIGANLPGVWYSSAAWGDYDNDGDLDILLTGETGSGRISRVYRNNGNNTFTDIAANLPGVYYSSSAWGDYDNDGDLDILLTGETGSGRISRVYRNDGNGSFVDIAANLPGVANGSSAWGDYDNDGDLDILLAGSSSSGLISRVYRNEGSGSFTEIAANLPGVWFSAAVWGDYDNDGDLDILLAGFTGSARITRVYRNDGNGSFTDIAANLTGVAGYNSAVWGDFDNDGDLDILLTGHTGSEPASRVYRNDGNGTFTDIAANLTPVHNSSAVWGDFDNDGDLDILLAGHTGSETITRVYRNDGNDTFADIMTNLPGVSTGSSAWGDYDNDGDLDILLTGSSSSGFISRVYRTAGVAQNTPPTAPSGLTASTTGSGVTLSWNPATDTQTPPGGLSYNLRVGTTPGGQDILAPMSRIDATSSITAPNGWRRIPDRGPIQTISHTLTLTPGLTYYWSVQAVDTAFAGSPFAAESSFDRRTPTATATSTPSNTATPSATSTPSNTAVPTNTGTATNTPLPTVTSTPSNTAVPTNTGTATNTPLPTVTSTPSNTAVPTGTSTALPTGTSTTQPTGTSTAPPTSTSTPSATATFTQHFVDVPPSDPFFVFVEQLHDLGVVSGYGDNTFRPYNPITRGQIAKIVALSAGFAEDPGPQIFSDVSPSNPFFAYVNRLANRGIVGGYPCPQLLAPLCTPENPRLFRPGANATRGQLTKIVSNAAGFDEPVSGQHYADVPPTGEGRQFYEWIMRLTSRGVIGGYNCGAPGLPCDAQNRPYFRPAADVTRGQAAKIVANTFFPPAVQR